MQKQADYEVGVITQMNFPGYFLVVADFINWAKDNGIRVGPGRGSGAGSMVAYAMRITDLNPLQHGLIFERFLNPDRVSMPDFDVDFDERRRGDVIRYVTEKYGDDRVAQIVTYGTIKAKQAVKDAARVLGMPFSVGDRITKVMPPPVMGKDVSLAKIFEPQRPPVQRGRRVPHARGRPTPTSSKVVETARGLEGLKRQWGVHAAGVIMSSAPLLDLIPIMKREQDGAIITQFDYPTCERLGLIKMDFLGLRNLTVLDDALPTSRPTAAKPLCWRTSRWTTRRPTSCWPAATRSGCSSSTAGRCGRCCARCGRTTSRTSPPSIALYRPGPMGANSHNEYADRKNNRKPVVPIHPELAEPLAEILGDTYGLIVYQEQVMAIAQHVAGYSLGAADLLRRAMGKKKKAELDAQFETFSGGMAERGYSAARDQDAVGHPAAVLRLRVQQGALRRLRADVLLDRLPQGELPGRVHGGAADQRRRRQGQDGDLPGRVPVDGHQRAAARRQRLGAELRPGRHRHPVRPVRGAQRRHGRGRLDRPASRKDKGAYTDFYDFLEKVDAGRLQQEGRRVADQGRRVRLPEPPAQGPADGARAGHRRGARAEEGRGDRPVRPVRRDDASRRRATRSAATSRTPSGTPSSASASSGRCWGCMCPGIRWPASSTSCPRSRTRSIPDILDGTVPDRGVITVGGILTGLQRRLTKKGDPWASATLEDLAGGVEVAFFPKVYAETGAAARRGRDRAGQGPGGAIRGPAVAARAVRSSCRTCRRPAARVRCRSASRRARCTPPVVDRLRDVLQAHPGTTAVHLRLLNGAAATTLQARRRAAGDARRRR